MNTGSQHVLELERACVYRAVAQATSQHEVHTYAQLLSALLLHWYQLQQLTT